MPLTAPEVWRAMQMRREPRHDPGRIRLRAGRRRSTRRSAARRRRRAKVLAGGQSLLPLLKLRLAGADTLIDIGRIRELAGVRASCPTAASRSGR